MDERHPSRGISLNREQRDALHREVCTDLSGIGDVNICLSASASSGAEEARRMWHERFLDDGTLLDALGWSADDPREAFEVTDVDLLRRFIDRTKASVTGCLSDSTRGLERLQREQPEAVGEVRDVIDQDLDTLNICDALLAAMAA